MAKVYLKAATVLFFAIPTTTVGILYPRQSETRETLSLDGLWNFAVSSMEDPLRGFRESWHKHDLNKLPVDVTLMPVPSSYNDVLDDPKIRDHVGLVWYDRTFFVPSSWSKNQRIWLRFSSVSYWAQVWINGKSAKTHEIGHLPFEKEITPLLSYGMQNRITVACNNTLTNYTVPQGSERTVKAGNATIVLQSYKFDFFNYAGIDRPVTLYTTPVDYIEDITVQTDISGKTGYVGYHISFAEQIKSSIKCSVTLFDKENKLVASNSSCKATLQAPRAEFWWPYHMHPQPGYLYTLQVELLSSNKGSLVDVYRLPVGIRKLTWTNTSLLINDIPLYLHGFGRHEDSDIRGKGLDFPLIVRDYSLIKWVGANAYRTSHYPYADEIMDLADQNGIMIIDECPSVDTGDFSAILLKKHMNSLFQLINRDKNRPSVIAWSIANEPTTDTEKAGQYFGAVADYVRSLDLSRPITLSINTNLGSDHAGQHLDIISFNRYNSWYANVGRLDTITDNVVKEATSWHKKYGKPVLMSEYGADTISGLHLLPAAIWSEDYQVELMSRHFKAFDYLRSEKWFIGEFIWNFADFKTAQNIDRVDGNKKGIFTRNRQPKAAAHHLRRRYWRLAQAIYNRSLPSDLFPYTEENRRIEL